MSSAARAAANAQLDKEIARRAAYQRGLMTTQQLRELGVTQAMQRTRLGRGQWAMLQPGVLRIGGFTLDWEARLLGFVLSAGDEAVASHRSAARLFDLDGFRFDGTSELVVPHSQRLRRSGVVVHRSNDLDLIKPTLPKGIPATPVSRTLLDLGSVVSRQRVLLAVDDARRRDLTTWNELLEVLAAHACRGRGGVPTLRSIIDECHGDIAKTDSGFERLVMILLAVHGLPAPVLQHEVHVDGKTYRIDLAYVDERVALELDGQVHLNREVWERDHYRQTALTAAGWHVLRFTWRQYQDHSDWMLRQIRHALRQRGRAV